MAKNTLDSYTLVSVKCLPKLMLFSVFLINVLINLLTFKKKYAVNILKKRQLNWVPTGGQLFHLSI